MTANSTPQQRRWVLILGDQLWLDNPALKNYHPDTDTVWMAEVSQESTKVWSHQARIVTFISAMRHFRHTLQDAGFRVNYTELTPSTPETSLAQALIQAIEACPTNQHPTELHLTQAGEWSVQQSLVAVAEQLNLPLHLYEDTHFLCSRAEFEAHAKGRKQLRMEFFYRWMRQQYQILMQGKAPLGGQWNFDKDNRGAFSKAGPGTVPQPLAFPPDEITQAVIALVRKRFGDHPGTLDQFDWPVTRQDALRALDDFITHRLPQFGTYQDAMWASSLQPLPYLYHSRLSAAMNLHLLDPREVIAAAENALHQGHAGLESVEGFIRQILGWREYVRGIYWLKMPEYLNHNALGAHQPLPSFYWTGQTDMTCLRATLEQTLATGYAHHIQRLMITGLFALLLGVSPQELHEWYLAIYVDAIEWVELPNTLGMSQYGDGGLLGSKPYVASGQYIKRMSNYCTHCPYDPTERVGPTACPFTTLYWDFLIRHYPLLSQNPRMGMQLRNLSRLSETECQSITKKAQQLRQQLAQAPGS